MAFIRGPGGRGILTPDDPRVRQIRYLGAGGAHGARAAIGGQAFRGMPSSQPGLLLDPYLYPPANSATLQLADERSSIGAGTITTLSGIAFTLPKTQIGVINSVTLLLDGILITSRVFW